MKRQAKTESGKHTKAAILQATAQIVLKEGLEKTNTNRIAELAGVSIGSLYQYFENKEQIFYEILKELVEKRLDKIQSLIGVGSFFKSTEDLISHIIDSIFVSDSADQDRLESILIPLVFSGGNSKWRDQIQKTNDSIGPILKKVILLKEPGLRGRNLNYMVFLLGQSARGIKLGLSLKPRQKAEMEELREEIKLLFVSYLKSRSISRTQD